MQDADDFLNPDHLPHLDPHASLDGLGPVELHHPTIDLVGDSRPDTATVHLGDDTIIAQDIDGDGYADHLKAVDSKAEYSSWEYRKDSAGARWVRTDQGRIGG